MKISKTKILFMYGRVGTAEELDKQPRIIIYNLNLIMQLLYWFYAIKYISAFITFNKFYLCYYSNLNLEYY